MGRPLKSTRRNRRSFRAESLEIRRMLTVDYLYSLAAHSGAPDDGFGWSHAMSADYHIVGNPFLDRQPVNGFVGEVQVHDADTGALLRTIANPDPGDLYRFGYSVDIFDDLIVIGAIGWGDLNTADTTVPGYSDRSGRAYLFEASTGNLLFTFDGTFTTGNPLSEDHDQFGASVSIDGNYVIVGAPGIGPFEPGGLSPKDDDAGHAYIFSTTTGTLLHLLGSPEPEAANPGSGLFDFDFGLSVATSNGKVVVGNHDTEAYGDDGNFHAGKAYIFDAASGQLQHTLMASDILQLGETTFGHQVAIDENLIAVSMDSTSFPLTYVFDATTGNLNQILEDVLLADINADQVASRVFVSNAQPTIFGSILNADSGSLISTIPLAPAYVSETTSFLSSVSFFQTRLMVGEATLQLGNSGNVFVYDTGTNAPPTDITLSASTVAELAAVNTVVGALTATDSTPGETLTFSLLNSSGGRFAIDGTNLVVANGSLLNFELQATHGVTVRVMDSAGNTYDEAFTIDVTDVNEAATLISLTPNNESENTTNNAVVGSLSSNDPDAGETESFVLLDDAGGRFLQDGLVIRVADASLLDFETDSSHQIMVRVTDSAAHVLEQVVTINITDFNYQPTDIGLTGNTANESAISLLRNPSPERQLGFGSRVAASDTRLLVSHVEPFTPFTYDGRVYLYDAATRSQIATLFNPTGMSGDRFGQGIAISDAYAVVGAGGEDTVAEDSGRAYVYDSTTGALLHVLNNPDQTATSADDEFGSQVSISGTVIAIRSSRDAIAPLAGAVHLFDAVSGNLLTTIQSPEPTEPGQFGAAISMMDNKILIGAPANNSTGISSGRAYLYEYDSVTNTTSLLMTLDNPSLGVFDLFGSTVAVTADVLVVASPGDNEGANDAGRVYLFSSTTGALLHTLQAPGNEAGDVFGISLAASGDQVIVASRQANGLSFSGQIHVFSATTGNLLATIDNPTPEAGDLFGDLGSTIAVNATHIVVGSAGDQTAGVDAGLVYLLDMPIGEVIGSLSAVDVESTESFTFSLTDNAGGRFGIDGNNLIVADPALLDFEVSASHDVTVQVTDSGGATFSKTFTIQLANVVETSHVVSGNSGNDDFVLTYSPSIFGGTVSVTVSTNGGAATPVGTYPMQQSLVLNGAAGSDSILVIGTGSADVLSAFSENSWSINGTSLGLSSIETRSVDLGAGNDQYYFDADVPLGAFAVFESSGGIDRISLSPTTVDVSVNLNLTSSQAVHPTNLTLQLLPANAFEQAEGGSGNDLLTGTALANTIFGGSGNDTITGAGGSDFLFGGLGNDLYVFSSAPSAEADVLVEQADQGTDTLSFASVTTAVTLNLNLANVQSVHVNRTLQLSSPEAFEDIIGGSAGDTLTGNGANNRIQGRSGSDVLAGAGGNDSLEGGVGNDLYVLANALTAESDFLVEQAGQGTDTISFSSVTSNIKMYLASNGIQNVHLNRLLQINSGTNFENMIGGSGFNDLVGNAQNNVLTGQGNPDSLVGNGGNDTLIGGGGNDSIVGGEGSDFMDGGSGNDLYTFNTASTAEADSILELDNDGIDTLTFSTVTDNIALSLATIATQSIHLNRTLTLTMESTIENVFGGNGNDTLTGNNLRNEIRGSHGNDTIHVGTAPVGEVEFLVGGSGNDSYVFQSQPIPAKVLIVEAVGAGGGMDELDFSAVPSDVSAWLNSSASYAVYANQTLQLNSSGSMEIVSGGSGNDNLFGNALDNVINGNAGNDSLRGSAGSDQLHGGGGDASMEWSRRFHQRLIPSLNLSAAVQITSTSPP